MNELLDVNLLQVIHAMGGYIRSSSGAFISIAMQIASILLLFVIARESFNLMLGNKSFDPIWWIRPIIMVIIIGGWNAPRPRGTSLQQSLPAVVTSVFGQFEHMAKARFISRLSVLDNLKQKKMKALEDKHNEIQVMLVQMETARKKEKEENQDVLDAVNPKEWVKSIEDSFEQAKESFKNTLKLWTLDVSHWVDKIVEFIGNFIWKVSLYATLMIKELSLAFLYIFGPLSFGLSVYDEWRDAWASWLMRFISFQFYGFVAYTIMTGSLMIISYGVQNDIKVLAQPGYPEAFSFSAMYTLFGYIVGAFALKIVPEVVSWIVPTNSSQAATHFASGVSGAVTGAAFAAPKMVGRDLAGGAYNKVKEGATSGVKSTAKSAGGFIRNAFQSIGQAGSSQKLGASAPPSGSSTKKDGDK